MKRSLSLLILALFLVITGYAQQRSEQEALSIANNFYKELSATSLKSGSSWDTSISLAYTSTATPALRSADNAVYYYVFNVGDNNGYIIVSGDERAKEILGYAENGKFEINSIPDNFRYWLSYYEEELELLGKQPAGESQPYIAEVVRTKAAQSLASYITPLLGSIKWNQGAPYNNLCPTDTTTANLSVTGCVATGMAQVMRYHKWPETGKGSHSYNDNTDNVSGVISATFEGVQYDWNNMLETYTGTEDAIYQNAVATLMFHCGVSVDMNYASAASGANSFSIPNALVTYFGYDPNIKAYSREVHNKSEWIDIIKTELNTNRPILYSGRSDGGGHLFVCDGYDSNNRFHFNWGWSGSSDGYFEITALNPSSLGIGGGTGGGYNNSQYIFTGIQKPTNAADTSSYEMIHRGIITTSETEIARNATFTVTAGSFGNFGVKPFSGNFGIILTTESGDYVATIGGFSSLTILPGYSYNSYNFTGRTISSGIPNGNYRMYSGYREDGGTWKISGTRNAVAAYAKVTVTDSKITFSSPADILPALQLNSIETIGNLYQNITGQFKISVTNTGGEYFDSYLGIYLQNKNNEAIAGFVAADKFFIGTGETKEFILSDNITYAPGEYYVAAFYDPTNTGATSLALLGTPVVKDILATPVVNTISLELTSLSFPDNNNVTPNTFNLKAEIKNKGDFYDGVIYLYYNTVETTYRYHDSQSVILEPGEQKTYYFTSPPPVAFGAQRLAIRYYNPLTTGSAWLGTTLPYTYKEDLVSVIENKQILSGAINIYPNPASSYISFESEENVKSVRIINLMGQVVQSSAPCMSGKITIPVDMLSNGSYILQVETENEVKVARFIKK